MTALGDAPHLVHEVGVDGEATGGVDDHDVATDAPGFRDAVARHRYRVGGLAEHRHAGLLAEHA